MSKDIFARIIETEERQFLVLKKFHTDKPEKEVEISTQVDGVRLAVTMTFDTEQQQEETFNRVDERIVSEILTAILP